MTAAARVMIDRGSDDHEKLARERQNAPDEEVAACGMGIFIELFLGVHITPFFVLERYGQPTHMC
jgi:hypothetical protein